MDEIKNAANEAASKACDTIEKAAQAGSEALKGAQEGAREFTSKGLEYAEAGSEALSDFAKRQPWVALAGAFLIGYVAARTFRRLSL